MANRVTSVDKIPIPYPKYTEEDGIYVRCPRCALKCRGDSGDNAAESYRIHYRCQHGET